jgi:hypothetical protein
MQFGFPRRNAPRVLQTPNQGQIGQSVIIWNHQDGPKLTDYLLTGSPVKHFAFLLIDISDY